MEHLVADEIIPTVVKNGTSRMLLRMGCLRAAIPPHPAPATAPEMTELTWSSFPRNLASQQFPAAKITPNEPNVYD